MGIPPGGVRDPRFIPGVHALQTEVNTPALHVKRCDRNHLLSPLFRKQTLPPPSSSTPTRLHPRIDHDCGDNR